MIHLQAGHYLKHFNLCSLILSTLQPAVEWSEVEGWMPEVW